MQGSLEMIGKLVNIDPAKTGKYVRIHDVVIIDGSTNYLVADNKGKEAKVISPTEIIKIKRNQSTSEDEDNE